jgi:hypothetical protein
VYEALRLLPGMNANGPAVVWLADQLLQVRRRYEPSTEPRWRRMWVRTRPSYRSHLVGSTSNISRWRSSRWLAVALVRGALRSST